MKKTFRIVSLSPEIAGLACGGLMLAYWPLLRSGEMTPGWALLALVVIAGMAGILTGATATVAGERSDAAVRRGAMAGVWATFTAAAAAVLMYSAFRSGGPAFMAQIVAGASLMPAMLTGTVAAGLGMLCSRRQEPKDAAGFPLTEIPKLAQWAVRAVIGLVMGAALLSPFFPVGWATRPRVVTEAAYTPPPPSKPATPVEPIKPAPPFSYEVPAALLTAPPVAWRVESSRNLGPLDINHGVAFSKDGRYLGVTENQTLVVHDLHTEAIPRVCPVPALTKSLAFSPDGTRVFVIMEGDPRRVGVADLSTNQFIPLPQPKKYAVPDTAMVWWKDNTVVFLPKEVLALALDLDILEFDPTKLSEVEAQQLRAEAAGGLPANERWAFQPGNRLTFSELPEVEGTEGWRWRETRTLVLNDRKLASKRLFPDVEFADGDSFHGVPDGSKLLRVREGVGTVYYFDTGPVPPLRWTITMPHGPDRMEFGKQAEEDFATGKLSLLLYSPLVNPLNNRTVGPDRERPKAILRIRKWEDTTAEVWVESGIHPWAAGDIFADLHTPGPPPQLLVFDQRHRWWTVAPDPEADATDPAKLPLLSEFTEARPVIPASAPTLEPAPPESVPIALDPKRAEQIKKEIADLIRNHHQAALDGRVTDLVNDYADRVDYLEKGNVDREFIRKDEIEYRQRYHVINEEGKGNARMKVLSPTTVQATYEFVTEWLRLSDNLKGGGYFQMVMLLEEQPEGVWRIVRQRTKKIK